MDHNTLLKYYNNIIVEQKYYYCHRITIMIIIISSSKLWERKMIDNIFVAVYHNNTGVGPQYPG